MRSVRARQDEWRRGRGGGEEEEGGTHILLGALHLRKVRRCAVTPPELTGDAPILVVAEPAVPLCLALSGTNEELSGARSLRGGTLAD